MHNYEVLYDKIHADFHRKDIKKNALKAVSEELGLGDSEFLLNQSNAWSSRVNIWSKRFNRVYSGILKIKIIILWGEEADRKTIYKNKGLIRPCKKSNEQTFKSGTSTKAASKAAEKLFLLKSLQLEFEK